MSFSRDMQIDLPKELKCFLIDRSDWVRFEELIEGTKTEENPWNPSSPNFWLAITSAGFALLLSGIVGIYDAYKSCVNSCTVLNVSAFYLSMFTLGLAMLVLGFFGRKAFKSHRAVHFELLSNELRRVRERNNTAENTDGKEATTNLQRFIEKKKTQDDNAIQVGRRVKHPAFGPGTVKERRGDIATIIFDSGVRKMFAVGIAPITII